MEERGKEKEEDVEKGRRDVMEKEQRLGGKERRKGTAGGRKEKEMN